MWGKSSKWKIVEELCAILACVLWFHVVQVDIPERQGNVVVLYEVC